MDGAPWKGTLQRDSINFREYDGGIHPSGCPPVKPSPCSPVQDLQCAAEWNGQMTESMRRSRSCIVIDKDHRRVAPARSAEKDGCRQKLDLDDIRSPVLQHSCHAGGSVRIRQLGCPDWHAFHQPGIHDEPSQPAPVTISLLNGEPFHERTCIHQARVRPASGWIRQMEEANLVAARDCLDDRGDRAATAVTAFALRREWCNQEHAEDAGRATYAQIHSDGRMRRVTLRTADSTRRRGRP
jgi:hypothetical protein